MTTGRINQVATVRRVSGQPPVFQGGRVCYWRRPRGPHPPRRAGDEAPGGRAGHPLSPSRYPRALSAGRRRAMRTAAASAPPVKARSTVAGALRWPGRAGDSECCASAMASCQASTEPTPSRLVNAEERPGDPEWCAHRLDCSVRRADGRCYEPPVGELIPSSVPWWGICSG